jgi:sensor histidine kinase YesM
MDSADSLEKKSVSAEAVLTWEPGTAPAMPLRLRVFEPYTVRFATVRQAIRAYLLALVAWMAFAIGMGLWLSRWLIRPVRALTGQVTAYGRGDYRYPRPRMPIRELDSLAQVLAELGEKVSRQIEEAAEQERIKGELERAQIAAELGALREQMRPHFIFNALNNIAAMIPIDGGRATEMLTRLSDLYRLLLDSSKNTTSPLAAELTIVRHYLELQHMRYGSRLKYEIKVSADEAVHVPSLVLQTLVENAVKHGIGRAREGGEVILSISPCPEGYHAEVWNSGAPLTSEPSDSSGTGLRNTRKRLDLLYGAGHRFRLFSNAGGTCAEFYFTGEAG